LPGQIFPLPNIRAVDNDGFTAVVVSNDIAYASQKKAQYCVSLDTLATQPPRSMREPTVAKRWNDASS
jgi:hypothetical protein